MEAAHAASPIPTSLTGLPGVGAGRRPTDLAGLALAHLAGGAALLAALGWAYKTKRRLGIDVFPGLDMLPDPQIEATIDAVVRSLGW